MLLTPERGVCGVCHLELMATLTLAVPSVQNIGHRCASVVDLNLHSATRSSADIVLAYGSRTSMIYQPICIHHMIRVFAHEYLFIVLVRAVDIFRFRLYFRFLGDL